MYTVLKDVGNLFMEETGEQLTLDTKNIAHPSAAEMVATHFEKGKCHFNEFLKGLESGEECTFYQPIKKNKVDVSRQQPEPATGDLKQNNLKEDCRLFSRLFISCLSRECDLLEFCQHGN